MTSYWLAPALATLRGEIDDEAPDRSTASDGWIGDEAHASRDSDHNPANYPPNWTGVVRAFDFTHDPAGGLNCDVLATELKALFGKHPAMMAGSYIIWEDRIISFDRLSEGWRPYSGDNEHRKHLHLSVTNQKTGYNSTAPWGVMEADMAFTDADRALLKATLAEVTALRKEAKKRAELDHLRWAAEVKRDEEHEG